MLGVIAGSILGARVLVGARVKVLRIVFAIVIAALGFEMVRAGVLRGHVPTSRRNPRSPSFGSPVANALPLPDLLFLEINERRWFFQDEQRSHLRARRERFGRRG